MQKDIQTSKGEISQQKFQNQPFTDKPSVGETAGHKMKEVGHDVNAGLKENLGVGVGNYSSFEDRQKSQFHGEMYEGKKEGLQQQYYETKEQVQQVTEPIGHKVQEIAHDVNATLKQNVGIGVGNYSSEVDQKESQKHRDLYNKQMYPIQEKIETKKEEIKSTWEDKKQQLNEKVHEGSIGLYTHRLEEVGHTINANLKEKIGIGIGDYSSEVDRQKAEEHWEEYQEKVKESSKVEVTDSNPIVHKIKEVAHTVNANLKEIIGVGVGNYSSEVDRELSELHHQKYEQKIHTNENVRSTPINFDKNKDKLSEKLFGRKANEPVPENFKNTTFTPPNQLPPTHLPTSQQNQEFKRFDESEFPKL